MGSQPLPFFGFDKTFRIAKSVPAPDGKSVTKAGGKQVKAPVTEYRELFTLRTDAIQQTKIDTLQGEVAFDDNGDIKNRVVSVFKVTKNPAHPLDDLSHQFKYVGVAPQSSS